MAQNACGRNAGDGLCRLLWELLQWNDIIVHGGSRQCPPRQDPGNGSHDCNEYDDFLYVNEVDWNYPTIGSPRRRRREKDESKVRKSNIETSESDVSHETISPVTTLQRFAFATTKIAERRRLMLAPFSSISPCSIRRLLQEDYSGRDKLTVYYQNKATEDST